MKSLIGRVFLLSLFLIPVAFANSKKFELPPEVGLDPDSLRRFCIYNDYDGYDSLEEGELGGNSIICRNFVSEDEFIEDATREAFATKSQTEHRLQGISFSNSSCEDESHIPKTPQGRKLFGPEFVFVPKGFDQLSWSSQDSLETWIQKWLKKARTDCSEKQTCRVERNKVIFEDGFWYALESDLGNVIEVTTSPRVMREFAEREKNLQESIFDFARSLGLVVPPERGGHIHLDISHFEGNPTLFMNFFIDCQNHPELFLGALGMRPNNPPLITSESSGMFKNVLEDYSKSIASNNPWSIEKIAREISSKVYELDRRRTRNNALNLQNLLPASVEREYKSNPFRTLEIRGIEAQKNAKEFILITRLFEARIRMLKNKKDLLKYEGKEVPLNELTSSPDKAHAPKSLNVRMNFEKYVRETPGIKWEDGYEGFLPPNVNPKRVDTRQEHR